MYERHAQGAAQHQIRNYAQRGKKNSQTGKGKSSARPFNLLRYAGYSLIGAQDKSMKKTSPNIPW